MKYFILLFVIAFNIFSFGKKDHVIISSWDYKNGRFKLVFENRRTIYNNKTDIKKEQEIIDLVHEFYPKDTLNRYVYRINIYSDGLNNDFAYVEDKEHSKNRWWSINFDIQDSYNHKNGLNHEYFYETLVHEFFHIYTLNHTQVNYDGREGNTYYLYEGSTYPNSYLNLFFNRFWKKGSITRYLINLDYSNISMEEKRKIREELYSKYSDSFVNEYAMTNPVEDIAESFTYYVFHGESIRGRSVKDKKMIFFDNFPELKRLKKHFLEKRNIMIKRKD